MYRIKKDAERREGKRSGDEIKGWASCHILFFMDQKEEYNLSCCIKSLDLPRTVKSNIIHRGRVLNNVLNSDPLDK